VLTTVGTILAVGGRHGRHGLRIVALVLLVAAVVAIVLWMRHRRRTGKPSHAEPPLGDQPDLPARSGAGVVSGSDGKPGRRRPRGEENTIEARGLTKHYGEKLAVDDLSFDVRPGSVTGFLGPNGAGKSTTMRMIMGLDAPDRGAVRVHGRSYHDLGWPLREVGALLEADAIHPGRTARAHLWMLARTNHIPRRRVDEVLDLVGLTSVAHQRAGQFSLGMSQRLGIAVALLGDPGVLMFDEPVNGLDTDGIRWVRQLLRRLAGEGRAVFVSSHLMSEMALTADQVVVIGKGRLIAEMPIEEFTTKNSHAYVRVRSPRLGELRSALTRAGGSVADAGDGSIAVRGLSRERVGEVAWNNALLLHELATQSASLEEAFVESTEGDVEFSSASTADTGGKDGDRR